MTDAERGVLAASRARDICLSLRQAFAGPRALDRLRAGGAPTLRRDELELALGLAWAGGEVDLVRSALSALPEERVARDAVLATFRAAAGDAGYCGSRAGRSGRAV